MNVAASSIRAVVILVVTATLAGCAPIPATQTIVSLSADDGMVVRGGTLRVAVVSPDGASMALPDHVYTEDDLEVGARIPIVPRDGDWTRVVTLRAELLDAGARTVARIEADVGFGEHELRELRLRFTEACRGVLCDAGQTCVAGECVGACFDPVGDDVGSVSQARCGGCERCRAGACTALPDGTSCGCAGDVCRAGGCAAALPAVDLATGSAHTCVTFARNGDRANEDVVVHCWGDNSLGQLGSGDLVAGGASAPYALMGGSFYTQITSGDDSTCVVAADGVRTCWGENSDGQLGAGDLVSPVPTPIGPMGDYVVLSLGQHACGITSDGFLECWGANAHGEAGPGPHPLEARTRIGSWNDWTSLEAEGFHSCGLRGNALYCWGMNANGELGLIHSDGRPDTRVVTDVVRSGCLDASCDHRFRQVAHGAFHTCAIDLDDHLYCWGGNTSGQVTGEPPPSAEPRPTAPTQIGLGRRYDLVEAGARRTCAVFEEGRELECWGNREDVFEAEQPTRVAPPPAGATWRRVDLGEAHVCAVRDDDSVWCWGSNAAGQLGVSADLLARTLVPRRLCPP